MRRRDVLTLTASATLAACIASPALRAAAARPVSTLSFADELDAILAELVQGLGTMAGLAVAVLTPHGAYSRGIGLRDVAANLAADSATAFYIASSTKPLTALALAMQTGRQRFQLNTPINHFAPDAAFPDVVTDASIGFDELLSHRAGLTHDALAYRLAFTGDYDPDLLWALLGRSSFASDRRGRFHYSNIGYNIATVLTDRVWGEAWQDILARSLFEPAGMTNSAARRSALAARGVAIARPHAALPEGIIRLSVEKNDATMHSAGGVMMSADDALRWLELLIDRGRVDGRVVVPASILDSAFAPLATTDTSFEGYARTGYGLGWYSGAFENRRLLHHFGGFAGARAHVSLIPEQRAGVIVLQNDSSPVPMAGSMLARFVYRRLHGVTTARQALDAEIAQAGSIRDRYFAGLLVERQRRSARRWQLAGSLDDYAGQYHNQDMGTFDIMRDGGGLSIRLGQLVAAAEPYDEPESVRVELVPQSGAIITFIGQPPAALRFAGFTFVRMP